MTLFIPKTAAAAQSPRRTNVGGAPFDKLTALSNVEGLRAATVIRAVIADGPEAVKQSRHYAEAREHRDGIASSLRSSQ